MCLVNISSALGSPQVKKSHGESHVPDPSDDRYSRVCVCVCVLILNDKQHKVLCRCRVVCVSMLQGGDITVHLRSLTQILEPHRETLIQM